MKWTPWPLLMILLAFMLGYGLGSLGSRTPARPVSQNEWRQALHEQQPEPMMAQAVGGIERWLL